MNAGDQYLTDSKGDHDPTEGEAAEFASVEILALASFEHLPLVTVEGQIDPIRELKQTQTVMRSWNR